MDSARFDGLVQSFGESRSRRQTLRGLAGLVAVGALALGGQEADAAKRNGGSPCTRGRQCKTGKCVGTSGAKTCSCSKRFPTCAASDTSCQSGACAKTCLAPKANCTDAAQCCQDGGTVECQPIGNLNQDQCCSLRGSACSTPGANDECCLAGGSFIVICGSDNTCGGAGARCSVPNMCVSAVCCGEVCCAPGQQCEDSTCTG